MQLILRDTTYNFSQCRITRFNRITYIFKTQFELFIDLNKEYEVEVTFHHSRFDSSQYDRMPFEISRMLICDFLENFYKNLFMDSLKAISNFPQFSS